MASGDQPRPAAKVGMDANFEKRLRELREHAQAERLARSRGGQVRWFRPSDWDGDVFDHAGMGGPFSRDAANAEAVDAVKDPKAPGTTADTIAAAIMIETLAVMERAFRARHTLSRCRAVAHVLARKQNHGAAGGTFIQNGVEYARAALRQARAGQ